MGWLPPPPGLGVDRTASKVTLLVDVSVSGISGVPLRFKSLGDEGALSTKAYKQPTPGPPPVRFRYESTPGGNMSQHMPPYGHQVGFVCMGGTPSSARLAQTPKLGGTPIHTKPTRWP